jgi:hypothetical protein
VVLIVRIVPDNALKTYKRKTNTYKSQVRKLKLKTVILTRRWLYDAGTGITLHGRRQNVFRRGLLDSWLANLTTNSAVCLRVFET